MDGEGSISPQDQRELQMFMQQETQKAQIQQAVYKITEMCFEQCVSNPGSSLSSRESDCVQNCTGRYLDSSMYIMKRLVARAQSSAGMQ